MWFCGQLDSGLLCLGGFYNEAGVLYGSSFINVLCELKGLPLFKSEKKRSEKCLEPGLQEAVGIWRNVSKTAFETSFLCSIAKEAGKQSFLDLRNIGRCFQTLN